MRVRPTIFALAVLLAAYGMSPGGAAAQQGEPQNSAPAMTTSSDTTATDRSPGAHAIYTSGGDSATMDDIIAAADTVDVVFVGEVHDDETAHALQIALFEQLVESTNDRAVALSMEMFERDVQPVLDEYLADTISETHFVDDARAWQNYASAYHPMVERAKAENLAVLAANAPRRYVSQVARGGQGALNGLSAWARQWVAPLPFPGPTAAYQEKWETLMRQAMPPGHGSAAPDTSARESSAEPPPRGVYRWVRAWGRTVHDASGTVAVGRDDGVHNR